MSNKFKALLVLMSVSLLLCMMSNTYSRYIADTTGNVTASLSSWQILINNSDITNNETSSVDIVPTILPNENVAPNTIAPSSKGYFDVSIDPSNVDVSFDYEINLSLNNEQKLDLMITNYSIIDENYIEGDTLAEIPIDDNKIANTLNYDTTKENFKFNTFTVRVYFEWYEGDNESMNDEADTAAATSTDENINTLKITANIKFTQKI